MEKCKKCGKYKNVGWPQCECGKDDTNHTSVTDAAGPFIADSFFDSSSSSSDSSSSFDSSGGGDFGGGGSGGDW